MVAVDSIGIQLRSSTVEMAAYEPSQAVIEVVVRVRCRERAQVGELSMLVSWEAANTHCGSVVMVRHVGKSSRTRGLAEFPSPSVNPLSLSFPIPSFHWKKSFNERRMPFSVVDKLQSFENGQNATNGDKGQGAEESGPSIGQ